MRKYFLEKVRLTQYFIGILCAYILLVSVLPSVKYNSGALTLFSVNSFLYGFYIAPILSAQRARIEDLHRIVRAESNAIFAMVLSIKKLAKPLRNQLQNMFIDYLKASVRERKPGEGEAKYESIISYCVDYTGPDQATIDKLLEKLVANQQNRTNFAMQMNNKVFSNEWLVMLILFSITLCFVLFMDTGHGYIFKLLAAFLCAGLSMLIIILIKMSTLTHKKAKQIWDPYKKLIDSHFYRID